MPQKVQKQGIRIRSSPASDPAWAYYAYKKKMTTSLDFNLNKFVNTNSNLIKFLPFYAAFYRESNPISRTLIS